MIKHRTKKQALIFTIIKLVVLAGLIIALIPISQNQRSSNAQPAPEVVSNVDTAETAKPTSIVYPHETLKAEIAVLHAPLPEDEIEAGDITFSGSGTPGSSVEILINGDLVGTAQVDIYDKWEFTHNLKSGAYDVSLRTVGMDGIAVGQTVPFTINVMGLPAEATAPVIDPLDGWEAGFSNTVSGTDVPGTTVQIQLNGIVAGTVIVGEDGTWSFDLQLDEAGDYEIIVSSLDADGQVLSASDTMPLQVTPAQSALPDAPTLNLSSADELTAPSELTLTGMGTPGATVQVVVNGEIMGTTVVGEDGTWSLPVSFTEPGDFNLSLQAVDANGTVLAESSSNLSLAADALAAPQFDSPKDGEPLTAGIITLTGAGEPGSMVQITADGVVVGTTEVGADGTWSYDHDLRYTLGSTNETTLSAQTLDASGSPVGEASAITVTAEPSLFITSPAPDSKIQFDTPVISGTGPAGQEIELLVDGEVIATGIVNKTGEWSFVDLDLVAGSHDFSIRVAGETADQAAVNVTLTAPPQSSGGTCKIGVDYGVDMGKYWLVKRCDTIEYISAQTGISLQALLAANPQILDYNLIYINDHILLPGRKK